MLQIAQVSGGLNRFLIRPDQKERQGRDPDRADGETPYKSTGPLPLSGSTGWEESMYFRGGSGILRPKLPKALFQFFIVHVATNSFWYSFFKRRFPRS